jgi:hypothetical protein
MPWWVVIGFLILLVLGTFLTLYLFEHYAEGFQTTPTGETQQLYNVKFQNGAAMTHLQATTVCMIMGGRLALASEVYNGAVAGKYWTTPGWIGDDMTYGYYPVNSDNSAEGIIGPAIIRAGGELNANCDGSFTPTATNSANCYGILPPTNVTYKTINYTIIPEGGSFTAPLLQTTLTLSSVLTSSTAFDSTGPTGPTAPSGPSGSTGATGPTGPTGPTYTILDLDAINLQKSMIAIDMQERNSNVFNSEKAIFNQITQVPVNYFTSVSDPQKKRIYNGYVLAKKHIALLKNLSDTISSYQFTTDPYYSIIQACSLLGASSDGINFPIDIFKNILLNNINTYYSDVISKLNNHPVAYICSGVLNSRVYLNAFGITTSEKWEYFLRDDKIFKQTMPPYPGCGTHEYNEQKGPAKTSLENCPKGRWWQDLKWVAPCPRTHTYGWHMGACVLEWPQFQQLITNRDLNLVQQEYLATPAAVNSYPTNFLLASDGWVPTAVTTSANLLRTKFIANKTQVAKNFGITTDEAIQNTYRWKPITYVGTLSAKNIEESKQSALMSALFNFTDDSMIENQIRITSYPPFALHYSKNANAKPEFVQIVKEASRSAPSNAELLASLMIMGVVVSGVASVAGARATARGASSSSIGSRASLYGGIAGFGISVGAAAGMATSQGASSFANIQFAASNADYNMNNTTPLTEVELNLLPYHTRQFISVWATMRKERMIEWYVNSVYTTAPDNKNPPGGPYSGSPKAAAEAATWGIGTSGPSTVIGAVTTTTGGVTTTTGGTRIYDTSTNIFANGNPYRLSESTTINSIDDIARRKMVYDSMAQMYYEKNGGQAFIKKILDVYQVGTTLYDVRFTESRRSGTAAFINKINELNNKYNKYRFMNISEKELDTLESTYSSSIEKLYDDEKMDRADTAQNCGVKATFVKITRNGVKPFNMSQIMVINNFGQNVALSRRVSATSTVIPSHLNKTGTTYYDSNYNAYDESNSRIMAARDNSGTIMDILSTLTDGTYITRYDSFYESSPTDTAASITIDLGARYDISVITLLYNPAIDGGNFKVELFATSLSDTAAATKEFICGTTGTSTVEFLLPRADDAPKCPTSIYSQIKIARFFASSAEVAQPVWRAHSAPVPVVPLTFTGFSYDGATTFNPLYNGGFSLDIGDTRGSINYTPVTVFNITPATTMPDCSDPERMKRIFKDHYLSVNSSKFKNRADIKLLTNKYDDDFTYKPTYVVGAANASTDKYKCAYIWKENKYNSDGSIVFASEVERYGVFNYVYDTENWVSRGIVFDMPKSVQYSDELALPVRPTRFPNQYKLYIPYRDSVTLDNKSGIIPETDCSDPAVINSVVSAYNKYSNTFNILRVTKALTVAPNKCEYEFVSNNNLKMRKQIEVTANENRDKVRNDDGSWSYVKNGTWSYVPLTSVTNEAVYLDDDTPLLGKAYNYASETIKPFVDKMNLLYTDLKSYLDPHIDASGTGIKGDLITYRNTTNTAAGIIRNVSVIGQPVVNELGVTCTTRCNSPEIIQSFFTYHNNAGGDKVTQIQNAGMDASGNCDFTYQTAPIIVGATPSLGAGMTRAAKFRISRYLNSCAYKVTGTPAVIMPTPDIDSILSFNTPSPFGSASGSPSGGLSPINTAQVGISAASSAQGSPSGFILAPGSPYIQTATIIENVDYINCFGKYALNTISSLGVTGSVTAIGQKDAKSCAVTIDGVQNEYKFSLPPATITSTLVPTRGAPVSVAVTAITPTPISAYTLAAPTTLDCLAAAPLTGLRSVVASQQIGADTCEYKITINPTLPFANSFQRATFYNDNGLRLKSIVSSDPVTSPYAYFKASAIRSTFIDDYMPLLQFMRYTWNAQFYALKPTSTRYWKMGKISQIGILANDDAVVFEAESCEFGAYGSLDIRAYSVKRYFKITPRINTPNGIADGPYTVNNINIYISEDSADANTWGTYRVAGVPTTEQYTGICTYKGINYSGAWYDSYGTGLKPPGAPPSTYVVQTVDAVLRLGYYNMARFKITAAGAQSSPRAEIARIMFYDTTYDTNSRTNVYEYQSIPNATVEIQDISSNYLLIERGKFSCDKNYRAIVDPETTMVECIYIGRGSTSYTQSMPCNTDDTTVSSENGTYNCLNVTKNTYTKPGGVACGLGYFGDVGGTTCTLLGDFQEVTQDPSYMFNLNQAVPRLRLELNKTMTINFNKTIHIDGFSFITGSAGTLPYQWNLEGSINGINWTTIHCQTTDYQYTGGRTPADSTTPVYSFFTPGIFVRGATSCNSAAGGPFNSAGYSNNNLNPYKNMAGNIQEGFKGGVIKPSYPPQNFKFRILETYDPNSKFVHMSSLEFYTGSGRVKTVKLSNLQGSRNSPKEGVAALLEGPQRRWVDYNKSDINIRIEGEPPITGFRFSIPDVPNAMAAMPIQWILYDGSNNIVHEYEEASLPLINNFATVVFKINNTVVA